MLESSDDVVTFATTFFDGTGDGDSSVDEDVFNRMSVDGMNDEDDVFVSTFFDGAGDGHAMLDLLTQLSPDRRPRLIAHTPQDIVQAIVAARLVRGEEPPWTHLGAIPVSANIDTASGHATYGMSSGEVVSVILHNYFVWGVETAALPASMLQTGGIE